MVIGERKHQPGRKANHLDYDYSGKINMITTADTVHLLYQKDGASYEHLTRFHGALLDKNGYLIFKSESDYSKSPVLNCGLCANNN